MDGQSDSFEGPVVLVGYIPTPLGDAALAAAIEEARRRERKLVVVNVGHADQAYDKRHAGDDDLDRVHRALEESSVSYEYVPVEALSDASDVLLRMAEERHAELVVVGIRHRSRVGKLLLGSSAQEILLGARCPVLAVKA